MSLVTLNKLIGRSSAPLASLLILAACSGDGRPLQEAVEANELQLQSLVIGPPAGFLRNLVVNPGTQLRLTLAATNRANSPINVSSTSRRWSVSRPEGSAGGNATVASIDEDGNLLALTEGTAIVRVRIGGIGSQDFSVTVREEVLDSIENIVGSNSVERCLPEGYRAEGRYRPVDGIGQGSLRGLPNAQWRVIDNNIGSVSAPMGGFAAVTAVNVGTLELVASFNGQTSEPKSIAVEDTLQEITIGPMTTALVQGNTLNLIANGQFINNNVQRMEVITQSVQWLADVNNGVFRVSNQAPTNGLVSTIAVGNAFASAACGTVQALRTVTVTAGVSNNSSDFSFEDESPLAIRLIEGSRRLRVSTGSVFDADNLITVDDETQWSVLTGSEVVDVNNTTTDKGLVTPLSVGTATIRVTNNGRFIDLTIDILP